MLQLLYNESLWLCNTKAFPKDYRGDIFDIWLMICPLSLQHSITLLMLPFQVEMICFDPLLRREAPAHEPTKAIHEVTDTRATVHTHTQKKTYIHTHMLWWGHKVIMSVIKVNIDFSLYRNIKTDSFCVCVYISLSISIYLIYLSTYITFSCHGWITLPKSFGQAKENSV